MQKARMNERGDHKGTPLLWTNRERRFHRSIKGAYPCGRPGWGASSGLFRLSLILLPILVCLASCAPSAGIFAGGVWQSGGLQHQHIRTLVVDPNNPQNIYAGDTKDGVFASTDAGMHWSQHSIGLPLPTAIHALVFDDPGKKLYAATDAGIFVSADAAQHWAAIGDLPADSYTALAFDFKDQHTIYAATARHGVFVSTNDGSSWSAANGRLPVGSIINGLAFDPDRHQLWAATNMGVYRSPDAGSTWHALNNGLPAAVVVNTVFPATISGGDPGLVFAGTNHGFFRSQDYGAHWSASQASLSGTSVNAILIDYHKATTVYVGISIGALRSDDNGQNWGGIAGGLPKDQPVYALAMGANNYNQLYAANNDVYLFPGSSSGFDPSQLIPILLILALFFVLYRLSSRGRRRSWQMLKPERIIETETAIPLDPSQVNALDKTQTNSVHPVSQEQDMTPEGEDSTNGC
jgi:photosystem II stability/assembly factor-like uncharacterized protein